VHDVAALSLALDPELVVIGGWATGLVDVLEPLHPLDEQAVAEVFARAREGDQRARAAVDRFIQRLVHDVAALSLALDPELVVIGGWATGLVDVLEPL
ncbi:ROK family protein, partial [Streptomyces sp. WM6386]|uniref:ROK family protein n=1 Tax=Streptomyces sp. WM6386 TaxID=1415558 RepID=UPI000619A89B